MLRGAGETSYEYLFELRTEHFGGDRDFTDFPKSVGCDARQALKCPHYILG